MAGAIRSAATLVALFISIALIGQVKDPLPRSTPEAEGVSSEGLLQFLDEAQKSTHEFHSIMVLRHGKVIAEGWWNPYRPELKHTMYSCSKSFTATAIGFAVNEGLLTVNDKVVSFFPGDLPEAISPNLAELRVRDLLSMSAGQDPEPIGIIVTDNWVKGFLAAPIVHQPGTKFLYNSACTYMLAAIVQKVTGQKVVDYLRPRLFGPLGIEGMDWEVDPQDINVGGWGLRIKTEDMAKFGQLFLQKGQWKGRQLLPAAWIEEASTAKIIQHPDLPQEKRDQSDWEQGYCYQMWRCRNNGYRGDGAFGQFIIVLPDKDAVIAITSETADMQAEFNLVWQYIFPALGEGVLPANAQAQAKLRQRLAALALPPQAKSNHPVLVEKLKGKTFEMAANDLNITEMSFSFKKSACRLNLKQNNQSYSFNFGAGKWIEGQTTRQGPYLVARAKASYKGLPPLKVAGSYQWKDDNTLELTLRYIESPHTETIVCRFDGTAVKVGRLISFNKNASTELSGSLKNN